MMPSIICGLSLHSLPPDGEGISLELWWPKGGGGASYWLGPLEERVCSTGGESGGDRPGGGREPAGGGELCGDGPEGGGESLGGDGPGAGESGGGVESAGGGGGDEV
ncbi:unnamed protein product [Prunus armeniaca]|uniref:Uncharacterized protein n=1 Tax=Prunus armeniaca TaxID=36596 RepID=A0A6J5V6P6_PRUAR|nr:unnamed protein product [Prunus armeniaca]CAB4311869.1 unnamed protein product [Prunus armeniaca]